MMMMIVQVKIATILSKMRIKTVRSYKEMKMNRIEAKRMLITKTGFSLRVFRGYD